MENYLRSVVNKQHMKPDAIANLIVQKGLKNTSLAMFPESERREILDKVTETYIRLGKSNELLEILEHIDVNKYSEKLKAMAEHSFQLQEYRKAVKLYEKIGDIAFAEYIKENFLKNLI
jgi:hypothetical protein